MGTPPAPVQAAVAVVVCGALMYVGYWTLAGQLLAVPLPLLLGAGLAAGLWRRWRGARGTTIGFAAFVGCMAAVLILFGDARGGAAVSIGWALVVCGLLLLPESTKRWFTTPAGYVRS